MSATDDLIEDAYGWTSEAVYDNPASALDMIHRLAGMLRAQQSVEELRQRAAAQSASDFKRELQREREHRAEVEGMSAEYRQALEDIREWWHSYKSPSVTYAQFTHLEELVNKAIGAEE